MQHEPGARLGPYEIVAPLGAGGMGEVYKATDTRLGRTVAIKTLRSEHVSRFEREARAIAALNHPHICQLYDIGPGYLVMEFVDGTPLISGGDPRPLPLAQALRFATEIAAALEAAHAKGITHRDLKPANILVTAAGVKLLDFGLAKIAQPKDPGDATLTIGETLGETIAGTILGTAAYMSPEQAEGQPADARSDIFSFGAVLYEMLAGRRAFTGASAVATMASILRSQPEPLHVPAAVAEIVFRCLRKSPGERFQTAAELRAALEAAALTVSAAPAGLPHDARTSHSGLAPTLDLAPAPRTPSIAVLPFANLSRDAEDEYFSDGLAEELIGALTQVKGLKVIARTSAFAFKGKNEDIRGIAETLGVTNVLEGSVRRAGNRVRVMAQLVHAADGTQLWSQRFDREMTDVFAIQDEISQAITGQLKVRLTEPGTRAQTTNVAAYEAVLEGRHALIRFTPTNLEHARQRLEHAIALDPNYAYAHASLAEYYVLAPAVGTLAAREALMLAEAAARRALELDPLLAEAHSVMGVVCAELRYDWAACDRHYLRALELNPALAEAHFARAYWCLRPTGRLEEAMAEIERALELDPLSAYYRFGKAYVALFVGKDELAAEMAQRTFDLDPSYFLALFVLAYVRARQGRAAEAVALAERAVEIHGRWPMSLLVLAVVCALAGKRDVADAARRELEEISRSRPCSGVVAIVNCALGHLDEAFAWAERAIEERDNQVLSFKTSPVYEPMRHDPRYPALLAKMNLA